MIYLHHISDIRMQGSTRHSSHIFEQICGADCLENVVLATTFWDVVDEEIGIQREIALTEPTGFWGEMVQKGSRVHRIDKTRSAYMAILESFAAIESVVTQAQEEMILQAKPASQTLVGRLTSAKSTRASRRQLEKLDKQHLKQLKREAEEAAKEQARHDSRDLQERQMKAENLAAKAEEQRILAEAQAGKERLKHKRELALLNKSAEEERIQLEILVVRQKQEATRLANEARRIEYDNHICDMSIGTSVRCDSCFKTATGLFYRK